MTSINMSYDITGSITKCHNDRLGLKLVYLWMFYYFSVILNVFIKIHEYANSITSTSYHMLKGQCPGFKLRPGSVVYDK